MYDIAVVGAGVVGLSVAMQAIEQYPHLKLLILEKENAVAQHQTGHNSGVIHSGVYYKPGSLKATLCVEGAREMVNFCAQHGIPHDVCGKIIVATTAEEASRLEGLRDRGQANGLIGLELLSREAMREIEAHVEGVRALKVPSTGITSYALVAEKYAELATRRGADLKTGAAVTGFRNSAAETVIQTRAGDFPSRYVINCAGLYSDRIARLAGHDPEVQIVPFRGEYYDIVPGRSSLVRNLIYPVPDPRFPFLGVHFTRRITGTIDAGPNAVLALRREGYKRIDFDFSEAMEILQYGGFRAMARKQWRYGMGEYRRSLLKSAFVRSLQRLVPEIQRKDLVPGGSGVRAQALAPDGNLVDDFRFVPRDRFLHVLNVPSPAATASLPIGREILKIVPMQFLQR
ncbi:MAG TPA: L-2-hydroxyglutarate oxidase [Terriglobales bacterium]|nr:L-2-hydroxyglutarate oxidase [Terriglobales bacterium]